jgi:hypothetical protein
MSPPDVALDHLEDQLKWYEKESARSKRMFRWLKTATPATSVAILLNGKHEMERRPGPDN